MRTGLNSRATGSAYVEMGATKVICAVCVCIQYTSMTYAVIILLKYTIISSL